MKPMLVKSHGTWRIGLFVEWDNWFLWMGVQLGPFIARVEFLRKSKLWRCLK